MDKTNKKGAASPIVNMTPQEIIMMIIEAVDPLIAARNESLKTILMAEIKDLKQGQTRIGQRVEGLEQGQTRIGQRVEGLEQGQTRIEQRVEGLEQGQTRIEQRVEGLEQGQTRIEHKLDTAVQDNEERIQKVEIRLGLPQ